MYVDFIVPTYFNILLICIGRSNYLPTVEHVAFLTELMEVGLNIMGLLETGVQILRELPEVETQLIQRGSPIVGHYTTSLLIQVVAILRRYHCSLLRKSSQDQNFSELRINHVFIFIWQ